MSKKPKAGPTIEVGTRKKTAAGRARPLPSSAELDRIVRAYRDAMRLSGNDQAGVAEHDDLPRVKIPSPPVRPKGVKPEQIRKAVRTAVQEYSEKRTKTLARP
jgi:hypothetical protein